MLAIEIRKIPRHQRTRGNGERSKGHMPIFGVGSAHVTIRADVADEGIGEVKSHEG